MKQNYSLCPKTADARAQLYPILRDLANRHGARLIDRSAGAERELSGMQNGKAILESSGGEIILITVEKPNEFRVSVTTLGLKEKAALSVRYWRASVQDGRIKGLFQDIERFWATQTVEEGVEDEPLCNSPT